MADTGVTGTFLTTPVVISIIVLLAVVALFVYFYRSNQDLLTRVTGANTEIDNLKKQNQQYANAIQVMAKENLELKAEIKKMNKNIRATGKIMNSLGERITGLEQQVEDLESVDGKKKKKPIKKTASREPPKPARKVQMKDDDSSDESSSSSSEEDEEDDKKKKKNKIESLI
jgi:cell division protein FtsB